MENYWILVSAGFASLIFYSGINFSKHQDEIVKGVFKNGGSIIDVLWHYLKRRSIAYFFTVISIFTLPFIADIDYLKSFVPNAESGSAVVAGIVVILQVSIKDIVDIGSKKKALRKGKSS